MNLNWKECIAVNVEEILPHKWNLIFKKPQPGEKKNDCLAQDETQAKKEMKQSKKNAA